MNMIIPSAARCVLALLLLLSSTGTAAACRLFLGADIPNGTYREQDANVPGECCAACESDAACAAWTFAPPTTCMLKSANYTTRVRRPDTSSYTSGCRDAACSAAPRPAPPTPGPSPVEQVCHVGSVCNAAYSVNRRGCCPYANATCCANNQTCCPGGSVCVDTGMYSTTCRAVDGRAPLPKGERTGKSVCKSGAALPPSKTLPNVLIIGDSVSIGYTPYVAKLMQRMAFVQHSPYDVSDGGAEETAYGVQCLDYLLRSPQGRPLKPDVIMFNWGLHDGPLGNKTIPGQAGLPDVYARQLEEITTRLVAAEPQAKLLYALTSPSMCDATGDGCVVNLNNQAATIMQEKSIPTINLHDAVVGRCGPAPQLNCFNVSRCFCPHCNEPNSVGYTFLAEEVIVPALRRLLPKVATVLNHVDQ